MYFLDFFIRPQRELESPLSLPNLYWYATHLKEKGKNDLLSSIKFFRDPSNISVYNGMETS